jgi:outer membrane receptor protein involved in Fe transport
MVPGFLFAMLAQAAAAPPPENREEEIVVTGERVRRSLKDTASSVAVVTSRELEAMPANRVEQVLALIPNVQLGSRAQAPAIRGQDTTGALQNLPAFLGGYRPRMTLIVDGRRTGYHEFVFGAQPVWDVDRIEVFRSPQTTTQGPNSIAGAILVYTSEPVFAPEMRARGIIGQQHGRQVSAEASGGLVGDQLAFRAAGDLRYSRTYSHIEDLIARVDPNHDVFGLLRLKLLAVPNALPGSRFTLSYSHSQSQRPEIEGVDPPFRPRVDKDPIYGILRSNVDTLTANGDVHVASDLGVNVVATAGDEQSRRFARTSFGESTIHRRDWSLDAVADWSPGGPVQIVGGLAYTHWGTRQFIDLSELTGIGRFRDWQDGAGIFGEARFAIAPKATLTAGLRYQRDRQRREGALGPVPLDYDRTFHAWLPKLSLAYDFASDFRAGLLVQRAYNPGGTTLRFDTGLPDNFDAERLWDYELFARSSLAGGAVTAEANVFYYDMRNAQRSRNIIVPTPSGLPVGFADLFNVSKARSHGLEASLDWRASRRLSAALAVGLLRTRILRAEGTYAVYAGREFQRSPHFSASAAVDWQPFEGGRLSGQVRRNSGYFSDDVNNPNFRVGGSTTVDARAEWSTGKVRLFAYARNLFDKFYFTTLSVPLPVTGRPALGTLGDPREVGVGIESRF